MPANGSAKAKAPKPANAPVPQDHLDAQDPQPMFVYTLAGQTWKIPPADDFVAQLPAELSMAALEAPAAAANEQNMRIGLAALKLASPEFVAALRTHGNTQDLGEAIGGWMAWTAEVRGASVPE